MFCKSFRRKRNHIEPTHQIIARKSVIPPVWMFTILYGGILHKSQSDKSDCGGDHEVPLHW